jgi:hypothetical protein
MSYRQRLEFLLVLQFLFRRIYYGDQMIEAEIDTAWITLRLMM